MHQRASRKHSSAQVLGMDGRAGVALARWEVSLSRSRSRSLSLTLSRARACALSLSFECFLFNIGGCVRACVRVCVCGREGGCVGVVRGWVCACACHHAMCECTSFLRVLG
jgi:hypothetical protein